MSKDLEIESELKAMNRVSHALKDLKEEEIDRVLMWVQKKYAKSTQRDSFSIEGNSAIDTKSNHVDLKSFNSTADLLASINPKTDSDKALIVASYLQIHKDEKILTGREVNRELNHLGHGVKNITNSISSLIKRKPQLMIQLRKEGRSQQAQKKYKVTVEGLKAVSEMLSIKE